VWRSQSVSGIAPFVRPHLPVLPHPTRHLRDAERCLRRGNARSELPPLVAGARPVRGIGEQILAERVSTSFCHDRFGRNCGENGMWQLPHSFLTTGSMTGAIRSSPSAWPIATTATSSNVTSPVRMLAAPFLVELIAPSCR
jgi:hypothetical protein